MIPRPFLLAALAVGLALLLSTNCQNPTPWEPVCPYECVCAGGAQLIPNLFNGTYMNCTFRRRGPFPVGEVPEDTVILDLSFNEMREIPAGAFDKMLHLEGVWLGGNHLSGAKVSPEVYNPLKYLQVIDLSFNDFNSIPQNVPETVKSWYFVSNKIRHLSSTDLERYPSLEMMQLSNNGIKYIPMGMFAKQTHMTTLQISSCPLTSAGLPNGVFKDAIRLQTLELKSDQLTRVPQGLPQRVKYLTLSSNNITQLYFGDFDGLYQLESLQLYSNKISGITTGAFNGLDNLKSLSLSSNHLTHLTDGMFVGLSNLGALYLYGNKLQTLSDNVFVPLHNLAALDVNSNSLTTLQYEVLYNPPFKNLTSLFIEFNPWNCDCRIRWLRALIDLKPYLEFLPELVKCAEPLNLQNMTWDILFPEDFVC